MKATVIINGISYHEVERLNQLETAECIVVCLDSEGNRFACPESVWESHILKEPKQVTIKARVNNSSDPKEKMSLFMSLFKGRDDVYAKRYYSGRTGKSGYVPACKNEWDRFLCDKKAYSCIKCPNRDFSPLTSEVIYKHLEGRDVHGRDVVGVYPMLKDETTYFLAVDFDGEGWQQDVTTFRKVCSELLLPTSVERSRSGDGAHIWFFFEEAVSAAAARRFGSSLLTKAMDKRHDINLKSYDRLFPNQDTLPKGGFGNLIALPLQGRARKNRNSLFIDESFDAYPDQWAFLSNIKKVTKEQLEHWLADIGKDGELGELSSSEEPKPWEVIKTTKLHKSDFPDVVEIILSDGIYINKRGVSQKALNKIKRMAAFKNPAFYKAQAMRLPTYNKPRIIDTSTESENYICIPRGCNKEIIDLLDNINVPFQINDKRNTGRKIDVEFNGTLREDQHPAAKALLKNDNGVLSATTAFGKTVVGAYIIAKRKTNTLILVHSTALLSQWYKALEKFLVINEELPVLPKKRGRKKQQFLIGKLGGGKNTISGIIDIAILQSLVKGDEVKELVRNYDMIICDECHHVPAFSFERVLAHAHAKYVYGLTATPVRQDGHQPIIFMQCGPVRYTVDAKKQAAKREFDHFVIPCFTSMRIPDSSELTIQEIYSRVYMNNQRNRRIIDDVTDSIKEGRTPIVLTQRKEHAVILSEALEKVCTNTILLIGSHSQKEKREKLEQLKNIPANEGFVIVATGKYVGEGFDEPRLDTLFLVMPVSWKGTLAQYVGRLHRIIEGKSEVLVYDYTDVHVRVLERMYQKRLRGYAELGYMVKGGRADGKAGIIFNGKNFYETFSQDIKNIEHEALIISPFMRKMRVQNFLALLIGPLNRKIEITIITRPAADYKQPDRARIIEMIQDLKRMGIKVVLRSGIHQKYAVFDQKIVWYGSINFLSYGKSEESIMRFENPDIAGELMDVDSIAGNENQG